MKKLILLATLVFGMNTFAQETFLSVGFDIKNAIVGSEPTNNKASFDGLFKIGMNNESGFEMQVQYESFKKIGFIKEAIGIGYKLPITEKLSITPLVEPTYIHRDWKGEHGYDKTHHLGAGFSTSTRYKISDKFGMELHINTLYRGDLDWRYGANAQPWVTSVYTSVTYYF